MNFRSFHILNRVSHLCDALNSGAIIKTCHEIGRHVVAFDDDESIFNAILRPYIASRPVMGPPKHPRPAFDDESCPKKQRRNKWVC